MKAWLIGLGMFALGFFLLVYSDGGWTGAISGVPLVLGACAVIAAELFRAMGQDDFWHCECRVCQRDGCNCLSCRKGVT